MSDLNMQLVREFFELNLFYVLPHWQFEGISRDAESAGSLLFVEQPRPAAAAEPECLLRTGDVQAIQRAVVEVRAWHADRIYASKIETNPVFTRVASEQTKAIADTVFNGRDYKIVLVVSEFSPSPRHRDQAVRLLQEAGIDHVIEFPTVLADMLRLVSPQNNYAPSHTLQTLRLLKRYNFIRLQQLELFFPAVAPDAPCVAPRDEEEEDGYDASGQLEMPEEEDADTGA